MSIPRESPPSAPRRTRALPVAAFALLEKSVHDAWAAGSVPVWSPDVSGGRPLAPNPNAGFLYPVRPLLAPLPFPLAMRLYPVLHWVAAGAGMILLLTALGASRGAAVLGAATYVFSGPVSSEGYVTKFLRCGTLIPWTIWDLIVPAR